jgi:glycosyltransferase involved in cell wall biosynthesis
MNVLHVTGPAQFGGIERLVLDLVEIQKSQQGTRVGVLFANAGGDFFDKFARLDLPLYSAELSSGYDWSPKKYRKVLDIFHQYRILHIHSFNPLLAACAVASGNFIVYTEHGNFAFGRKTGTADVIKSRLLKYFLNSRVDHISFNSAFTRNIAEKKYGLGNVPRSIVHNGIAITGITNSLHRVDDEIAALLKDKFVIGTTSRFAGFKRIDRLIKAFAAFQGDKPDSVLLLVGDGALRADLKRLVDELRISNKTIFAGYRENVHDFQNCMNVCVFPSENEPFGIAAVETMLLGKPTIICHDGGGLVEVVGEHSREDVVSDIQGMVARFNYYYHHRDKIADGAADRTRYASRFTIEDTAAQFLSIYQKVSSHIKPPRHVRN